MHAPPDLLSVVQKNFYNALLHVSPSMETRIVPGNLTAQRRVEIYRHNVLSNLRGAMQAVYPVILRLVGEAFFNEASDQYARAHPSPSGDLNRFGAQFAAFIAAYPYARDLPYLPDVARLEWAWHESFHATDAVPFEMSRLSAVRPDAYGALRFRLAAAVRLLRPTYPALRIWEVNQEEYAGDMRVDLDSGSPPLLVAREEYAPGFASITPGEYVFLDGLDHGMTLGAISECADFPEEDDFMTSTLQKFVLGGVIVDFELGNA